MLQALLEPQESPIADIRNRPSSIEVAAAKLFDGGHLNLVIPSMTRGGAERCVLDVLLILQGKVRSGTLFVLGDVEAAYDLDSISGFEVIRLRSPDRSSKFQVVAASILSSPNPVAFTHMIRSADLRHLWKYGVKTIPVVHNSQPGWHDPPTAYHNPNVPAVIAVCSDVASQLTSAGLQKPITVLRHEVCVRPALCFDRCARDRIRDSYMIGDRTLLLGMVGQFKAHKSYVRAVRVLAELRKSMDAKLLVLGGWQHSHGAGSAAYAATMRQARDLGVLADLFCPGPVENVEDYYSAFDVFLNTSVYEGMSIATLEAVQCGCPIVSADVGGQREAVSTSDTLVADPTDIDAYVDAIKRARHRDRVVLPTPRQPDLIPRLWGWIAEFGNLKPAPDPLIDVLFVTSNLNPGGAQRSLVNLLTTPGWNIRPATCVLDRSLGDEFISRIQRDGVPCFTLSHAPNLVTRLGSCLALARNLGVRTVCFWNVDPIFKLLAAKVLEHASVRIVDVSPGPMLFAELDETAEVQRRIAFSTADYLRRLDAFVAKYSGGLPKGLGPRHLAIIRNGVPERAESKQVDFGLLPADCNPRQALVTCCRLVPNKRLEVLVDLMTVLRERLPDCSLTVVGGLEQRHVGYFESVMSTVQERRLSNIRFVGPRSDTLSFLPAFSQFIMVSRAQGCPNASLEAMACGLPVIANSDGGTAEQVEHGVTGFVARSEDPEELAGYVLRLCGNEALRLRMGRKAKSVARKKFSMEAMLKAYLEVL